MYKLTDAYRFLVIEWGVPLERVKRLKISKVNEVLPAIRRGQVELEAGLSDAETLRRDDLEIQYRGLHSSMPGSAVAATSPIDRSGGGTGMGYVPNLRLVVPEARVAIRSEPRWDSDDRASTGYGRRRGAGPRLLAKGPGDYRLRSGRDLHCAPDRARRKAMKAKLSMERDDAAGRVVKRPTPRICGPGRRLQVFAGERTLRGGLGRAVEGQAVGKRYHGSKQKRKD
jgi:hypothetical protein